MSNPEPHRVHFRTGVEAFDGDVVALFPDLPMDPEKRTVLVYMTLGSELVMDYEAAIRGSIPASPEERQTLEQRLKEENIPYIIIEEPEHA